MADQPVQSGNPPVAFTLKYKRARIVLLCVAIVCMCTGQWHAIVAGLALIAISTLSFMIFDFFFAEQRSLLDLLGWSASFGTTMVVSLSYGMTTKWTHGVWFDLYFALLYSTMFARVAGAAKKRAGHNKAWLHSLSHLFALFAPAMFVVSMYCGLEVFNVLYRQWLQERWWWVAIHLVPLFIFAISTTALSLVETYHCNKRFRRHVCSIMGWDPDAQPEGRTE